MDSEYFNIILLFIKMGVTILIILLINIKFEDYLSGKIGHKKHEVLVELLFVGMLIVVLIIIIGFLFF